MKSEFFTQGYVADWPLSSTAETPMTIISSRYAHELTGERERTGYRPGSVVLRVRAGLEERELIYQPTLEGDTSHIDTLLGRIGERDNPRSLEGKSVTGIKQADRIVGLKV